MRKAVIVGGGVAGPVAAMALQRAGIEGVVYEAYPQTAEEVGSYLTVASNGLDALRAIDAEGPVRAAGFPTPTNLLLSSGGRRLGRVSNGGCLADGTAAHTIKRARLYRALHQQAADRGIQVAFGKRLVDAQPSRDGGVVATFQDGTQAAGALLVGADGVHSTARALIDPAAPAGRYVGLVNFGGYTPEPAAGAEPGVWHMIFGRRAFFGYVVDPGGGTVWFANVPRAQTSREERQTTSAQQWQQQLLELFADDNGPATDLITTGQLEFAGDSAHDLPKVPTWHKGPMVVIGDAAHAPAPTSGQGASMAAEDAVVLAKCLRDQPDIGQALAAYERLRRPRVERIVAQGARTGGTKTPGPVGLILDDAVNVAGTVDLHRSDIKGALTISGATFSDADDTTIDLRRATIGIFDMTGIRVPPAALDLRGATIDTIDDESDSWPLRIAFRMLTYRALNPLLPAGRRLVWLGRDDDNYHP